MENLTIGQIVVGLGAVTALWVFAERIIKAIDGILDKRLDPIKQRVELNTKMELQMMNHMIDGNHVEKLKTLRDEVNDKLVDIGN